jgi:TPR repeat protein
MHPSVAITASSGISMIDLHGLSVQKAKEAIRIQFADAIERGMRELYIITGRGNHVNSNGTSGVLKKILPKLLEPYADSITQTDQEIGAYKIILNKSNTSKNPPDVFAQVYLEKIQQMLEKKVTENDIDSMLALAALYLSDSSALSTEENIKKGIALINLAIAKGSAEASIMLAELYLSGACLKYDPKHAVKLLRAVAEQNPDAKFLLARCYLQGQGVTKSDDDGARIMRELAKQNHPAACACLGRSYLTNDFTESNDVEGVKLLQRAAVQGCVYAYSDLARCYGAGQGIAQNDRLALHFYTLAAEQANDVYALCQLGQYYSSGRGVAVDTKKGFSFYFRAAEAGDGDAQVVVAIAYFIGNNVEKDVQAGLLWLKKSADHNNPRACYLLSLILSTNKLHEKNTEKNIELQKHYMKCAVRGKDPFALFDQALTTLADPKHTVAQRKEAIEQLKIASQCSMDPDVDLLFHEIAGTRSKGANIFFVAMQDPDTEKPVKEFFASSLFVLALTYRGSNTSKMLVEPNHNLAWILIEASSEHGDPEAAKTVRTRVVHDALRSMHIATPAPKQVNAPQYPEKSQPILQHSLQPRHSNVALTKQQVHVQQPVNVRAPVQQHVAPAQPVVWGYMSMAAAGAAAIVSLGVAAFMSYRGRP